MSVRILIQPAASDTTAAVICHTYPTFEIIQQKKKLTEKVFNDQMRMVLRKKKENWVKYKGEKQNCE
jgi:hypothetical protein